MQLILELGAEEGDLHSTRPKEDRLTTVRGANGVSPYKQTLTVEIK